MNPPTLKVSLPQALGLSVFIAAPWSPASPPGEQEEAGGSAGVIRSLFQAPQPLRLPGSQSLEIP